MCTTTTSKKSIVLILTIAIIVACHNNDTHKAVAANDSTVSKTTVNTQANSRLRLIEELKKLQDIFTSGNKDRIGQLFHFPVPDSLLEVSRCDSSKRSGEAQLTKAEFDTCFGKIAGSWQLKELNLLFKYLDVNQLKQKNELEYKAVLKTEPCVKYYSISIEDSLVTVQYGINTNINYAGTKKTEDGECEYATVWMFTFDGEHLLFSRQLVAG